MGLHFLVSWKIRHWMLMWFWPKQQYPERLTLHKDVGLYGCWILSQDKLVYLHWHHTLFWGLCLWAPLNFCSHRGFIHCLCVAKCVDLKMKNMLTQIHSSCNSPRVYSYIRSEAGTHQKMCHLVIILLTMQRKRHGRDVFPNSKPGFLLCVWKAVEDLLLAVLPASSCLTLVYPHLWLTPIFFSRDEAWSVRASAHNWRCSVLFSTMLSAFPHSQFL